MFMNSRMGHLITFRHKTKYYRTTPGLMSTAVKDAAGHPRGFHREPLEAMKAGTRLRRVHPGVPEIIVPGVDDGGLIYDVPSSVLELTTQTAKAMAKKSSKKSTNQLASEAGAKQSDRAYPGEPHELNAQRQRLKQAAALGAEALKFSAPLAPPAKPPIQSEHPKSAETAPVVPQAPKPAVLEGVKVPFVLFEPDAKQVSLSGDFNGWASGAAPMKRQDDGHWELSVALAPGRYEYKFVVDGHWIPDPLAHETVRNQHGSLNSVVEVRA
jgi:hypothetical protein